MPSDAHNIGIAGTSERKLRSGSAQATRSPITTAAPLPSPNGPAKSNRNESGGAIRALPRPA